MVVLQINKFFWLKGGAERYFFSVSEALESRGHRVVHFSMKHPSNRPSPCADYFVSRRDYETPAGLAQTLSHAGSFIRSREAARNIRRLIADHRPDVAHLHNTYHQLTPSIIDALHEAGIPVVMTLHDYKLVCPNYSHFARGHYCYRCRGARYYQAALTRCSGGSFARSALLSAEAYWQRFSGVYGKVSRYIAPSRFMRERVAAAAREVGIDPGRIVHLPNFCPAAEDGAGLSAGDRAVLDNLPGSFVLYFGRLGEEKGLDTLLDAAERLDGVPFVLCGDGPHRASLERSANDRGLANVRFTGYANQPLLDRLVARAAVSVLPAIWPENAPFTVIEAAAAGVPQVVSDMGGLPEMAEVVSGRVFRHGDGSELAARIEELWSDPEDARQRAEAGRRAALDYFDRGRHVDALLRIYDEVRGQ
ncbi:MAG: glycosyltransferase [Candidatus Latescibacterota bacterium]|jgi:glycosyltransferase involved in cell wall biosynthesis